MIFIVVFLGERFLFDIIGRRQIRDGTEFLIRSGRDIDDDERREEFDGEFSVHYTYNFNIFVMMNFFNFFNCRILDDRLNIFKGILKSKLLILIMVIIFVL